MTILAVDDEHLIRTLLATVLEENGFDVLTADSAAKAIGIFQEHAGQIDLLISDIVMPEMDGPSLATVLQAKKPDLKVLLMSGYWEPDELIQGFEFMPKPFSLTDMVEKVRSLLQTRRRPVHALENRGKRNAVLTAASTH